MGRTNSPTKFNSKGFLRGTSYNKDYKSHELWGQVFQLAKQDTILWHTFGLINIQEIKRVWSFPYELLFSQLDYM